MRLYEINAELENLLALADEDGELPAELFDRLDQLDIEKEKKCLDIVCVIKSMNAEAAAYKDEIDTLNYRRAQAIRQAERLTAYLAEHAAGESYKNSRASLSWRKSEAVVVDNDFFVHGDDMVNQGYANEKIEVRPDKAAIKHALSKGFEVPGCRIERRLNPQLK